MDEMASSIKPNGDCDMTIMNQNIKSRAVLVDMYRERLSNDSKFAVKGLMIVFKNQLSDEVAAECTVYSNKRGFNKSDAKFLSQTAKRICDHEKLSSDDIYELQWRMPKYAAQIVRSGIGDGRIVKANGKYTCFE